MNREQLIWLAGWMEGEGTFQLAGAQKVTAHIAVSSTDRDVVERAAKILDTVVHEYKTPKGNPLYRVYLNSVRAVDVMIQLYPLMGSRRREQILSVLRGTKDHVR